MKNKFLPLLFSCFFTILFSCKNETPIEDLEVVTPEAAKVNLSFFKVTLNVIVKKDDDSFYDFVQYLCYYSICFDCF